MATPCIVATGTRTSWRGVPCKHDGDASWSGAFLVDQIVRTSLAATARTHVLASAHGWESLGGTPLAESDDFLGGDVVTQDAHPDVLANVHAVWVIDVAGGALEALTFAEEGMQWRDPARFDPLVLPAWYPQPDPKSFTKRRRPEAVTRELQATCRSVGLDWGPVCEALRRWVRVQLGDLTNVGWLYLGGSTPDCVRCLVDETFIYAATDSTATIFAAKDGRMRELDIDAVELLEHQFSTLGLSPARALDTLALWLTLASRHDHPESAARWYAGSRRWALDRDATSSSVQLGPRYLLPSGLLPTLLCWLF